MRYIIRYGKLPIFVKYDMENKMVDGKQVEVEVVDEHGPSVIEVIKSDLSRDSFLFDRDSFFYNETYRKIFEEACENVGNDDFDTVKYYINHPDPDVSQIAVDLVSDPYQLSKIHAKAIGERENDKSSKLRERNSLDRLVVRATTELKNAYVMQRIKDVKERIKKADESNLIELMTELKELQDLKMILAKSLGERIVLRF